MNVTDSKPIVGMVDYGLTASLVEIGGKPFLCSPYIPFEKLTPENTVFLCMQNEQLSPLEIFRILMWVMGNAVIGGYMTNVEDTINYLKSNGITMRSGKIDITFDIKNEKHEGYTMLSYDDRYLHAGHYTSIKSMADAFYNLLYQMSREFDADFEITVLFNGEEGEEFASLIECHHNPQNFSLVTLN